MRKVFAVGVVAAALATPTALAVPPDQQPTNNQGAALPAGVACEFPLTIDVVFDKQTTRTFFDSAGNPVRIEISGPLVLGVTNADTQVSFPVRLAGKLTFDLRRETTTLIGTGRTFVALFPSDFPPGPSSTITSGRQVITIDENEAFHLVSRVGRVMDVCAALS